MTSFLRRGGGGRPGAFFCWVVAGAALWAAPAMALRWFESYEQAQKIVRKGGDCTKAISLLQDAIQEKPQADAKARTVSMMVINYDPYYWLAQAKKVCGDLPGARTSLAAAQRSSVTESSQLAALESQLGYEPPQPTPTPWRPPITPTPVPTNDLQLAVAGPVSIEMPAGTTYDASSSSVKIGGRALALPAGGWQLRFERSEYSGWGGEATVDETWERMRNLVDAGARLTCRGDLGSASLERAAGCLLFSAPGSIDPASEASARVRIEALGAIKTVRFVWRLNEILLRLQGQFPV